MFDFQFLNWLWSVPQMKWPAIPLRLIQTDKPKTDAEILRELAKGFVPQAAIDELLQYRDEFRPDSHPRYWAVSNFGMYSRDKRLFVFDVVMKTMTDYYVAHGKGSDPRFTGYCETFSNVPGSLCSSEGIYLCAETYISSKFGYALRMDGLEKTNSNVRKRAIVFHGAKYAEDSYVSANGKTGRSEGCQAVGFQYSKDLIDKLKNGSLLVVGKWS